MILMRATRAEFPQLDEGIDVLFLTYTRLATSRREL